MWLMPSSTRLAQHGDRGVAVLRRAEDARAGELHGAVADAGEVEVADPVAGEGGGGGHGPTLQRPGRRRSVQGRAEEGRLPPKACGSNAYTGGGDHLRTWRRTGFHEVSSHGATAFRTPPELLGAVGAHVAAADQRGRRDELGRVLRHRRHPLDLHVRVRRPLDVDAEHQARVARDRPRLRGGATGVEPQLVAFHDEPDRRDQRAAVGGDEAELGGAGAVGEEVADLRGQRSGQHGGSLRDPAGLHAT